MINFIIGFVIGVSFAYLFLVFRKNLKQKRGLKYSEYKQLPLLTKIKDTLRHIIFEFGIKRNNYDFLLNISHKSEVILQVMHRAHFPYMIKKKDDLSFGLALYIPISKLAAPQKQALERIMIEEMTDYHKENDPFDYHVIDLGKNIKFGGYLISRILKDVFELNLNLNLNLNNEDFSFELFNDGELPYYGKKHGFVISPN